MLFQDAQRTLGQFLFPLSVDDFLDEALTGGFRKIDHDDRARRADLLGAEPEAMLASAFHLAADLTFHSANATGPAPSLKGVADADDFRARIDEFHARNYSLRFPDLRTLSPAVDEVSRALEILLHQPVKASAFWSRSGMRAPVHHDDTDLIIVQMKGRKRWFVSAGPSQLPNGWKGVSGDAPELGDYEIVDLAPGDLLYLPRGTPHTVESETESLHLNLGFTPLTVREAVIAALDQLSDQDRALRLTVGQRLGFQLKGPQVEQLAPPVADAVERLLAAVRSPGFMARALHVRSAREVPRLDALPRPDAAPAIDLDTVLTQRATAFCHLVATPEKLEFCFPGGNLYIHRGAQESVVYMVNTPRFRVRDIAGGVDDDVRLSLATRFLEIGYLEMETPDSNSAPH